METKHTEGEWLACCLDKSDVSPHYVFADEGKAVCAICVNDPNVTGFEAMEPVITVAEANANARLLQAAPELLEALDDMIRMYEAISPKGGWQGVYEMAVMARNKAMGL